MAPRAYWKGTLKLSLVACPILLYPAATATVKTRFHMINRETGNRLKQQMVDAETGDVVEDGQKARGYELRKGKYVELPEPEERPSNVISVMDALKQSLKGRGGRPASAQSHSRRTTSRHGSARKTRRSASRHRKAG